MNVGFVVECGPGGADEKVLKHVISELRPDIKPRFSNSGSKRVILEDCGKLVERLFEADRCERVFVVWDLMPCNQEHHHNGKPSCEKERQHLVKKLRPVDRPRTVMLCITHELEAWLLADGKAIAAVLGSDEHPIRIADEKRPEEHLNPKRHLNKLFGKHRNWDYIDMIHAVQIIKKVRRLSKLECAPSFARLKDKL
jgi:Domain of unknown function (DUF4276)